MLNLPYQRGSNPWRLTSGRSWKELGLEGDAEIDILIVRSDNRWRLESGMFARFVDWTNSRDLVVAFRPAEPSPNPPIAAFAAETLREQLETVSNSRDHYKALWATSEARRNLLLVENASLRDKLALVEGQIARLHRSAA